VVVEERAKWDDRYSDEGAVDRVPGALIDALPHLPTAGRALEIAGGLGAGARTLAERGLDVVLADISPVALATASRLALAEGRPISTLLIDFRTEPFPAGPWQVITCFHYLDRPLLASLARHLAPGGVAVVGIATVTNLELNRRPGRRFLLERGELGELLADLEVIAYDEQWSERGVHEARFVGRGRDEAAPQDA
jgi:SAM-dependent methyltransferase